MIHEAIEVYSRINEGMLTMPYRQKNNAMAITVNKQINDVRNQNAKGKTTTAPVEESYELTEEELVDSYLLENLGALYSNEK